MVHNKNVESSSKFKGHRHLSWATNDTHRLNNKVYQKHPTPKNLAHKCSLCGIYLKHLEWIKNEIKLWSKKLNSKNIELRSQGK